MSGGYTFTTITAGAEEAARIEVSFYLDDAARIRIYGTDCDRPQFCITHGEVSVAFLTTKTRVTEDDARIARQLADQAVAFAAEVERLRAEHDARAENTAA
ncbi:MAG TPA: hypothetical protein VGL63_00375 [Streptosporangiaceae bacterium]|jgi:hypothetical protein